MDMRPNYRSDEETMTSVYVRSQSDAPSEEDSDANVGARVAQTPLPNATVNLREIRDVVNEVRHELLHESAYPTFQLASKSEIMDADTTALWSTSLMDETGPMRDASISTTRGRSSILDRDPSTIRSESIEPLSSIKTSDTQTIQTASTFLEEEEDNASHFSSSCMSLPVFNELASEGFLCFTSSEMVNHYADRSHIFVETAATELLHESVLKGADVFFSDDQAKSLQNTFSEVSEEFDIAGNKVVDLTSMMNVTNACTCTKPEDVEDKVQEDKVVEQPELVTVPSEVTFKKIRALSSLKKKKSKGKQTQNTNKEGTTKNKGMFRKFKGRFRKGNRQSSK